MIVSPLQTVLLRSLTTVLILHSNKGGAMLAAIFLWRNGPFALSSIRYMRAVILSITAMLGGGDRGVTCCSVSGDIAGSVEVLAIGQAVLRAVNPHLTSVQNKLLRRKIDLYLKAGWAHQNPR
ncbi:hypothetical protein [Halomicronema sp. CCY15110]|uniref:hypothetical protein n=1 Tax=Halomicronema sp. CCY15110 TaxID=2767773 RepID=UPI00194F10F1|nr:hypothetical protein [Halomicronema sp. CCY15110]